MDTTTLPLELEVLTDLESAVARAQEVFGSGLWHLGRDEVVDVLHRVHRLDGPLQHLRLRVVHAVADRGVPEEVGATSLRS